MENLKTGSWVNGERSIVLAVFRQADGNTVAVVDAIRAALPKLEAQLPGSVRIAPLSDRSESIREAVHDVNLTLMLTVALVVMVIFIFLQRAAATAIPALSLPVSIIGTLALMFFLGFSLNNITLLALTLAVGLVVDDAVVVLENIVRYREQGLSALEAALRGSREVAFTILSISLSLVAIFIPIFYMEGVIGLLFHEFAVVVTMAVLVSALVSLTLIPMLAARFLRGDQSHGTLHNPLARSFERAFAAVLAAYQRTLDGALHWRRTTLLVALLTFAGSAWMFIAIPKGFSRTRTTARSPSSPMPARTCPTGAGRAAAARQRHRARQPPRRQRHLVAEQRRRAHVRVAEAARWASGHGQRGRRIA
ncbi:efflux RND transporter permease subunit [Vogesella fluminis]|uniref:efflux RND transporter permease subunit n=1 Tax=Vogesella fluminis TaxID=1069161 RepID=UPI00362B8F01